MMEKYIPQHRAEGRIESTVARFIKWTDEPMNGLQLSLCGAFMGLWWALLILYCYFG